MSLTCLPESELLRFALLDEGSRDAAADHLAGCAGCRERVSLLRAVVSGVRAGTGTAPSGGCLDEVALARHVEALDPEQRDARLAHLAGCGRCRRQVAALLALLEEGEVAAEVRALKPPPAPGWRRLVAGTGIGLAAAAVLLLLVLPHRREAEPADHRAPTITAAQAPLPIAPVGDVPRAGLLHWRPVAGAGEYRITLFDAAGTVLFRTGTADTVAVLPDSLAIRPGRFYLWKVEARTGYDRWTSSELTEFRVAAPSTGPGSSLPDTLRVLAARLSDSALVAEIRTRPQGVREAVGETLARGELDLARRIAAAWAAAWQDEFLLREVTRFARWSPAARAAKLGADSLRRAGVAAFGRDGATAAVRIWRRALAQAIALGDSAGAAATLGNIGAGLARDGHPDSAAISLEQARALAVAVGDLRVEANALSELAGIREGRGEVEGARDYYARAIALRDRIGDSRGLASDYNNLAGLARVAGDLDEARGRLEAALAINRRDGRDEVAATNLVNLAGLASLSGEFGRGATLYRSAMVTWRGQGRWADLAAALHGLGQLELRRGDYPAARKELAEALAIYDRTGPVADAFTVRQELAGALAAEGELQGALDELRDARQRADSIGAGPGIRAGIALARADLAAQLNSREEAERLYGGAERLFRLAGDRSGEAEAQEGRAMLLVDRDVSAAGPLLEQALHTQLATGNRRAAAMTRTALGDLRLRLGDTTGARAAYSRAARELVRLGDPVAAADAFGRRASMEAAAGLPAAADSLYRAALAGVGERSAPEVVGRLRAGLGAVLLEQGLLVPAERELRAGIAALEQSGRTLALPERRSGFFTDKWDPFVQLALLEQGRARVGAAFEASERSRASEMRELLAQGRVAPADTAVELVAAEQDLRRRIGELTSELEGTGLAGPGLRGPDLSGSGAVVREALLRTQESYAELLLEVRERAPRHAALLSVDVATVPAVARALPADAALIEYLVSDGAALAFVVTHDTSAALRLGVDRRGLAERIDFVRGALRPRGSPALDSLWRAPLRQLYDDLIAPVEQSGLLKGKTRLVIVPQAELHYLPFAALLGGLQERFLVERYRMTITPSASVWLGLGRRPAAGAAEGVLALAPRPVALPASREEVAAIGRLGGRGALILTGAAATEAAFRREAPGRRIIHLATYGVLNQQNPLFSYVALAPNAHDDGRLEVHEVFGLRLAADLVVLSACQTGLASGAESDVPAGDDWVGLARAFLSSGAGEVMATLWPVQDRASAALMEQFYRVYRADAGAALASAQRAVLSHPETASPYYWAGFELMGGR